VNKSVYILGGGPSLKNFDFSKLEGRDVIAVNKSIRDFPSAKYFITVDYLFLGRIDISILRNVTSSKIFVACLHFDYMEEQNGRIVDTRRNGIIYDLSDFDVIVKSRRDDGLGFSFNDFRNGLNSGFCALQLAIVLGYEEIRLLGIDLCIMKQQDESFKTHYHEGYNQNTFKFSKKLEKYYNYFCTAILDLEKKTDIKIISHSKGSRLNEIIEFQEFC
jgi:hypothetical protein